VTRYRARTGDPMYWHAIRWAASDAAPTARARDPARVGAMVPTVVYAAIEVVVPPRERVEPRCVHAVGELPRLRV
jgi:hypothetical protein